MRRQKELDIKISSLEFIVSPIKITGRHLQGERFFIEFDKGAQVLKKFDEEIIFQAGSRDYEFAGKEKGKFKLQNQRNSSCEWALYRLEGEEMSEFVDSLPTNLHECFLRYSESIKQRSIEYQHVLSEKSQAHEIWRQWGTLKEGLSWQFPFISARSKGSDIEISFRVEIRCELDVVSEHQRKKSVKSLKSIVQQEDKNNKKELQDSDDLLSRNAKMPEELLRLRPTEEEPLSSENSFEGYRINQSPPFVQPSTRKQESVLSDIIERSNQCSSKNKGSKKGELKDITDIPEQQSELHSPYSPLPNTKTQHFDTKFERSQSQAFKKRSNTFDSNKNPSLEEGEISLASENKKVSSPEPELSYDEQLENQQLVQLLEAIPQHQVIEQPIQQPKKSGNLKGFIAVFILLIMISFAAYTQRSLLFPAESSKGKREKPKKQEVRKKPKKQSKEK